MSQLPDILKEILHHKQNEVSRAKEAIPLSMLDMDSAAKPRGFYKALQQKILKKDNAVIAEIKKASPSKGIIRENFDPKTIAQQYENAGACCLSVLTDEPFFQGKADYLRIAREHSHLPIIRKDFIIDPYQVYQSRAMGADAILLIVAALSDSDLLTLFQLAETLELDVLVEVHTQKELHRALALNPNLIGINNRDLHSFQTSLQISLDLAKQIPQQSLIITESGINSPDDITSMNKHGIYGFLVGESLMRQADPEAALRKLLRN